MTRAALAAADSEVIDRVPRGTAGAFLRTYALRLLAAGEVDAGLPLLRDARPPDATVPPPAPGPHGGRRG